MAKKPSKSETLSIRMDPKTRFMLEFVARLRGQTITTVIERSISAAADSATVGEYQNERSWRDFWSVSDGERALKMAGEADLHPTWEEERRLAFTKRFWPFFYTSSKCEYFKNPYLEVLWPQIDEIIEHHETNVPTNANAGPDYMAQLLSTAKLKAPKWPPEQKKDFIIGIGGPDDEIPF
ncbi:hypothetical protein [Brucella intermedia]|uniref:hypothetical protein n=1 Tax=Brucella intermedia TaxID=94625 RepID=UPI00224B4557|nr:hypothetical protein [Brucella intermedia]